MKGNKLRIFKLAAAFLLVLSFGIMSIAAGTEQVYAAKIKISSKKVTLIKGQSKTLKVKGTKKRARWSSSKKSVASVSKKGKVTAKKKGTATITAKIGRKKYKCKVKVETPKLNKSSISISEDTYYQLKVSGNTQKVKWSSSNKSIVTVNGKGYIYGKKTGTVSITAKISSKKYKCKVTVKQESPKFAVRFVHTDDGADTRVVGININNRSRTGIFVNELGYVTNPRYSSLDQYVYLCDPDEEGVSFLEYYRIDPGETVLLPFVELAFGSFYADDNSIFFFNFDFRGRTYISYVDVYGNAVYELMD